MQQPNKHCKKSSTNCRPNAIDYLQNDLNRTGVSDRPLSIWVQSRGGAYPGMSKLGSVNNIEPPREQKHTCENDGKWRTTKLLGSASKIWVWNPVLFFPVITTVESFKTFHSNFITSGYKMNVVTFPELPHIFVNRDLLVWVGNPFILRRIMCNKIAFVCITTVKIVIK